MADPIGIATWNFRGGTLAERIERFSKMGYDAVSLIGSDACAMCRGEAPEVEEAISSGSLAVAIHAGFMAGREIVGVDSIVAEFELFARWHARTGALHTVNYDAAYEAVVDGDYDYNSEIMCKALRKMLAASNGAGFSVGVEDWPRTRAQTESVSELAAYPHFGVLVDLGHLNMRIRKGADSDDSFPVKRAQAYLDGISLPINELHVHNNDGINDLHAPPMTGTADMAELAKLLRKRGARCISTIEIVPAWCGLDEDQGWRAAEESLAFWKSVFADGED